MVKKIDTTQPITIGYPDIIRSLAVPFLAYEATEPYLIIDENEALEKVAFTSRNEIIGRPFLEVFPDTTADFKKTGKSAPIESIKKIVRTKQPDSLGKFQWDIRTNEGNMVQKHWRSTQYPIFDEAHNVVAVYQLTEDISHEKETEQALQKTQDKLFEVLSAGQVGTWSFDMQTGIAKGGPNLAHMFGIHADVTARGIALEAFLENIHPDDRERVQAEIADAVKSGLDYESEYRIVAADGNVRWVLARGKTKSEDLDGTNIFSGTLIDITDRKEYEHVLYENESRLRFMADSMPQLVWITRADGYHEYYNQRWYDYTGTQPRTTDGDGWNDLFYPADQKRASKSWNHSLKTGAPYEIEYRLYHAKTKTYRWVIGRALPFKNEVGEITKWYGTCTDIDDQKRAATQQTILASISRELVASMDAHKTLVNLTKLSVPVISDWCSVDLYSEERGFEQVSVTHADPKKIGLAKEYRKRNPLHIDDDMGIPRMLRTGEPEFHPKITNEMLEAFIDDEEDLAFVKRLKLCSSMTVPLRQGKKVIGGISFVSADSHRYFTESDFEMAQELASRVSLSITNAQLYVDSVNEVKRRKELEKQLRVEKQRLESRVKERTVQLQMTNKGLIDEITKRQAAEKDLSAFGEELSRSNKELEDFAYVASHDLQEPLRKIQAFGNLLLGEYGDSLGLEGADYLKRMHSAATRMSTLIEDLLAFSRVTRTQHQPASVDLSSVLADVLSDLESRIHDTGATITVGKMPTVTADPTHMRQLFQNLIGNAVKFQQPGLQPSVAVSSKNMKGGHQITVADNGIGFDEKYLDRIFAVFQRLHERSRYEGTGIGLAVCRKIVEQYGGTITAESTKGKGSKFIIWLPAKKERS
ncbi:PAS domain-containing protein [Candidatus Saccharibacteria bacterium]|nr:PAS domain-containing protein [Candidatus Saccharibacteria bacterium]